MKNVIPELDAYCKFLAPMFKARATGDKEADLTCRQALLMVLDCFTRADRMHAPAELDAAADALEAMTGAREVLELELFPLLAPPAPSSPEPTQAVAAPAEPFPAPPAAVPHAPGTNGAAAAYVVDAVNKHRASQVT